MSDDVVGPYGELMAARRWLAWLESRLAELAEAVDCTRAAVRVAPLWEPPVEPAPAAILTDVILSAEDVARIAEAHRRLWEAEVWRTPSGVTMPCDANRLAASHERLRVLVDVARAEVFALRAVLRELPDAVRALARENYPAEVLKPLPYVPIRGVMDWGQAMWWCVDVAIKRALAARGLSGG